MKISEMKVSECMDDTELIGAVAEITQKLVDKIFIAEDMNDAADILNEISSAGDTVLYECEVQE